MFTAKNWVNLQPMNPILSEHTIIKEKQEWRIKGFIADQPERFDLSVEFGRNHFSYAVYDTITRFLKVVGKIEFEFVEKKDSYALLFSELKSASGDILKAGYNHAYVTWNTPGATLVPLAFFTDSFKEEYLKFNNGQHENNRILAEEVRGREIKVIYSVPEPFKLFLDAQLSNHKLKHISTSLLEIILSSTSRNKEKLALININSSDFNLLLLENGLRFFNTFKYNNTEDILYYTLFAMEQNGFDAHVDKILLAGEIESGSGTHKLLQQYIKHIAFATTDKNIIRDENLSVLPHHYFFNLLNRLVCE